MGLFKELSTLGEIWVITSQKNSTSKALNYSFKENALFRLFEEKQLLKVIILVPWVHFLFLTFQLK